MNKKNTYLLVAIFFLLSFQISFNLFSASFDFNKNSKYWHEHNDHLFPSKDESDAIMRFDFDNDNIINAFDDDIDGDGIPNLRDRDIDGDLIPNRIDPSPYDWREVGYNPFGVLAFLPWNHEWNKFKYSETRAQAAVNLIKEAGIKYVRMDFIWNDIKPAKGNISFERYDFLVDLLSRNNIRILGVLSYSADWAADNWNNPPDNIEDFTAYAKKVVSRYKNRVKYWEVWNEPDSQSYWYPQDQMVGYANLLKQTYKTIKFEDPSSKVLLGGLTKSGYFALKNLYRQGMKDYFDIVNIHPFVDPLSKTHLNDIKIFHQNILKLMLQFGDKGKKIWFTELGAPGVISKSKENCWWEGKSPSESQQGKFLYNIYRETMKLEGVEKIFWAYFRDNNEHFCNGVDYFGLVRWDFSKKKSYYLYKKISTGWERGVKKGFLLNE